MLKVQLLLAESDILDDLSTVDSDGLADLLLGRFPEHHHLLLVLQPCHPHAPAIHMVVWLQNWPSCVAKLLKVRFAVMEPRKPGVTVEACVRLESGVHVVVDPSLNACLEFLRTILTLEVLSFVGPHYMVVQLQLLLSAEGTNLSPLRCPDLVHSLHVCFQIALTWKSFMALLTDNVFRVHVFMHTLDMIPQLGEVVGSKCTSILILRARQRLG